MVGERKLQSNGRQLGIAPSSSRYLIMEFCPGGELFDHIVEQGRVKEPEAVLGADHPLGNLGNVSLPIGSEWMDINSPAFTSCFMLVWY